MNSLKKQIRGVIFESETKYGKMFDVFLIILILLSVFSVILESVSSFQVKFGAVFYVMEISFTLIFTVEYFLRIYSSEKKLSYLLSFFGIIDLISIIPTWFSFFFAGFKYLMVLRIARLLRIFRVLKLARFLKEADVLAKALKASMYKITVFILSVATIVVILGALMYIVEGEAAGFTSIPKSIYWAIITLTTVGFGDIVPKTVIGQTISSLVMILGYGIIAIPTGIVTSETIKESKRAGICNSCGKTGHDSNAAFCKYCGNRL